MRRGSSRRAERRASPATTIARPWGSSIRRTSAARRASRSPGRARELTPEHAVYLRSLSTTAVVDGKFLLFHAALHPSPDVRLHLSSPARVRASLEALAASEHGLKVAFFGHTHRPIVHRLGRDGAITLALRAADSPSTTRRTTSSTRGASASPATATPAPPTPSTTPARRGEFHRAEYDVRRCRAKAARAGILHEPSAIERAALRVFDWLESGAYAAKSAVKGKAS